MDTMNKLLLIPLIILSGCATLNYQRTEPNGTVIAATLTEFATDANLEGFSYKSDTATVEVASRGQNQTDALKAIIDGAVSASVAETQIRQADDIANTVKAYGGKVIFITDFPRNAVLTASQLLQVEMVRNYAAAVGDAYIDPFNLYGPGNGTWTAGVSIDGTHMYNAYYDDLASRIAALID